MWRCVGQPRAHVRGSRGRGSRRSRRTGSPARAGRPDACRSARTAGDHPRSWASRPAEASQTGCAVPSAGTRSTAVPSPCVRWPASRAAVTRRRYRRRIQTTSSWMRASTPCAARPGAIAHDGSTRNARGEKTRSAARRLAGPTGRSMSRATGDQARVADELAIGQARVGAGAREHVVDVGLRVVVAEDRLAEVAVGVAQQRAQVVGGRGDRVGGVVDVASCRRGCRRRRSGPRSRAGRRAG